MQSTNRLIVVFFLLASCREAIVDDENESRPNLADSGPVADSQIALPDAADEGTVCLQRDPVVQLVYACEFEWSQCADDIDYTLTCTTQNVGGNIFSQCRCFEDGNEQTQFISFDICGSDDWESLEAALNEDCGWNIR